MKKNEPMRMTTQDKQRFEEATHCYLCGQKFHKSDKIRGSDKTRDHNHLSGEYRHALHMTCNLLYKAPPFIPVVMHGLRNFDSHIICQALGNYSGNISCIP